MPSVPAEATDAALAARSSLLADRPEPTVLSERRLTEMMLEAAAPILADAVARKILAHMDEHHPAELVSQRGAGRDAHRARRHLRTAAQVASLAFYTEADILKAAAKAIGRGDYIACRTSEREADD